MKYLLMGLAVFTVAAVAPLPASAITCPPGTHLTVMKNASGSHVICAQTMSKKGGAMMKKPATPKPMPKHT